MITTPDLIAALAHDAAPVRPLRPPLLRAAGWFGLGVAVMGLLALGQGLRPDVAECLDDPRFWLSLTAMLLTGISAAVAAFMLSLPDRDRRWLLLPAPPLALWIATTGYQCLIPWVGIEPGGLLWSEAARCFATLVLASLPLSAAMLLMLRHASRVRPREVSLAGSLAVAALAAAALSLTHDIDASLMVLVWNIGSAALLIALGGAFGRGLLTRLAPRPWVKPRGG